MVGDDSLHAPTRAAGVTIVNRADSTSNATVIEFTSGQFAGLIFAVVLGSSVLSAVLTVMLFRCIQRRRNKLHLPDTSQPATPGTRNILTRIAANSRSPRPRPNLTLLRGSFPSPTLSNSGVNLCSPKSNNNNTTPRTPKGPVVQEKKGKKRGKGGKEGPPSPMSIPSYLLGAISQDPPPPPPPLPQDVTPPRQFSTPPPVATSYEPPSVAPTTSRVSWAEGHHRSRSVPISRFFDGSNTGAILGQDQPVRVGARDSQMGFGLMAPTPVSAGIPPRFVNEAMPREPSPIRLALAGKHSEDGRRRVELVRVGSKDYGTRSPPPARPGPSMARMAFDKALPPPPPSSSSGRSGRPSSEILSQIYQGRQGNTVTTAEAMSASAGRYPVGVVSQLQQARAGLPSAEAANQPYYQGRSGRMATTAEAMSAAAIPIQGPLGSGSGGQDRTFLLSAHGSSESSVLYGAGTMSTKPRRSGADLTINIPGRPPPVPESSVAGLTAEPSSRYPSGPSQKDQFRQSKTSTEPRSPVSSIPPSPRSPFHGLSPPPAPVPTEPMPYPFHLSVGDNGHQVGINQTPPPPSELIPPPTLNPSPGGSQASASSFFSIQPETSRGSNSPDRPEEPPPLPQTLPQASSSIGGGNGGTRHHVPPALTSPPPPFPHDTTALPLTAVGEGQQYQQQGEIINFPYAPPPPPMPMPRQQPPPVSYFSVTDSSSPSTPATFRQHQSQPQSQYAQSQHSSQPQQRTPVFSLFPRRSTMSSPGQQTPTTPDFSRRDRTQSQGQMPLHMQMQSYRQSGRQFQIVSRSSSGAGVSDLSAGSGGDGSGAADVSDLSAGDSGDISDIGIGPPPQFSPPPLPSNIHPHPSPLQSHPSGRSAGGGGPDERRR